MAQQATSYTFKFDKVKPTSTEKKNGGTTVYFWAVGDSNVSLHSHIKKNKPWDDYLNL